MALNQVQFVAPRQEQQKQQTEKKDWKDYLLEGLQIANGITGLYSGITSIEKNRGEIAAQEDARNGLLTGKDILGAQASGLTPGAAGDPGGQTYKMREGENIKDIVLKNKVASVKPELTYLMGPKGEKVPTWVTPGQPINGSAWVSPEKPSDTHFTSMGVTPEGTAVVLNTKTGLPTVTDTKLMGKGGGVGEGVGGKQEKIYSEAMKEARNARGEPGVAQAQRALVNINNADAMLSKYISPDMTRDQQISALNAMTPKDASLFQSELAKIAAGGVAGEHTQNMIAAKTLASKFSEWKAGLNGEPTGAQLGGFLADNKEYLDELRNVNQSVVSDHVKSVYAGYKNRFTPDQQARWESEPQFAGLFEKKGASNTEGPKGGGIPAKQTAAAPTKMELSPTPSGFKEDPTIRQYVNMHKELNGDYNAAAAILAQRGYTPK